MGAGSTLAQSDDFELDRDTMVMSYWYNGNLRLDVSGYDDDYPMMMVMVISNRGEMMTAGALYGGDTQVQMGEIPESMDWDTVFIQVNDYNNQDPIYPLVPIVLRHSPRRITIGANCIKVDCIPFQDPYMPTTESPTRIGLDNYYLYPKNNRIYKGSRAAFKFDECELEKMILIHPFMYYTNSKGEWVSGSRLIKRRRMR
jgi:hypothetical protein